VSSAEDLYLRPIAHPFSPAAAITVLFPHLTLHSITRQTLTPEIPLYLLASSIEHSSQPSGLHMNSSIQKISLQRAPAVSALVGSSHNSGTSSPCRRASVSTPVPLQHSCSHSSRSLRRFSTAIGQLFKVPLIPTPLSTSTGRLFGKLC
jgi:hypothetical protein